MSKSPLEAPLSDAARAVLAAATVTDNVVYLASYQLDQALYTEVHQTLVRLGGSYGFCSGSKKRGHIFLSDPAPKLAELLGTATNAPAPRPAPKAQSPEPAPLPSVKPSTPIPAPVSAPRAPSPEPHASMKLTIPRKEFMTALATVRPVAGGSLPILNTVLIDAQAKGVTLTCSNLDLHLRLQTEASVETPGRATIRAALLWDAIRLADGVDVTLTLKKHQLKIECGQTRHEVVTLPPEDFPPFPAIGSASPGATSPAPRAFFVEDAAFRNLLAETTFACSKETERAILTGVALQIVKSPGAGSTTMHVVACNGFMLATNTIAVPDAPEFNAIIPADTARELLRLLSDDAEKPHRLNITASEGHIQFAFANGAAGDLTLHSRLIEGQFPPWQKIVPQDNPTANLSRTELARSIERIAIVGDQVRLAFTPQSLVLTSVGKRGTDFLGDAYDSLLVPANHSVAANFSTKFLLQILSAIPDGAVELHINAEGASLFKTPGRDWRAVLIAIPEAKEKVEAPAKDKAPATKAPSPEPKAPEQTETPGAKTPAGTDKLKSKKK